LLQDPNIVRCESSRHIRYKLKEYLKARIDVHKNISYLYTGISKFNKVYHPATTIVKMRRVNLVTDFHSISARWSDHFSQLLNVHGVNDVRQTEIHTAEPLVPFRFR
jgi:hypothetical protein